MLATGNPVALAAPQDRTAVVELTSYRITVRLRHGDQIGQIPTMVSRALDLGAYKPGMEIFVDCRGCSAPGADTIRALANAMADSRDMLGPLAILTDTDVAFGMGRMLEILTSMRGEHSVRVFRQAPNLESWLRRAAVA